MRTDGELTMLEKLTAVLSDGDWHSTAELVEKVGHRFSATMHTAIRKQGYKIEKRRNSLKQFEYQMQSTVQVATQNY
jgi:biotin operon repressor